MRRTCAWLCVTAVMLLLPWGSISSSQETRAKAEPEPDHIRGQITSVEKGAITVRSSDHKLTRIELPDTTTFISLSKGNFSSVDFGTYVGSVAVQLNEYSPIVRDSAVWLHKGFELRIIDEELRGIALGHKKWSLTPDSIIAHGWVDDIEDRVLSIKWGPSDYDETDVEIARDAPVLRMSLTNKSAIQSGAQVFAGAHKGAGNKYQAVFIFIGKDSIVPSL